MQIGGVGELCGVALGTGEIDCVLSKGGCRRGREIRVRREKWPSS